VGPKANNSTGSAASGWEEGGEETEEAFFVEIAVGKCA
jgi:hypothetical protein